MNPFFKKGNIFLAKKSIFSRKPSKNWADFTGISDILQKIIFKFSIFLISYKTTEIEVGFYYQVEKIIKRKL